MSRILIVDDAQFMRLRVAKLLTGHGYETVEAGDGDAAVKMYRLTKPDLVLLDITMPGKDGLAALAEIRQMDPQAKVVILSALSQQTLMLQAMQAGAKDFLVKPPNPEQIVKILQKLLEKN